MKLWKFFLFILALGVLFHSLAGLGVGTAFDSLLQSTMNGSALVEGALLNQSPLLMSASMESAPQPPYEAIPLSTETELSAKPETETAPPKDAFPDPPPPTTRRQADLPTLTLSGTPRQPNTAGVYVNNHTTYTINIPALLSELPSFIPAENPTVLILHAHGTESFEPDGADWYENINNYRTTDTNLNITRVGREIAAIFEARGITVLHNQYLHDYPSFRGSYERAFETAQHYLAQHPDIQIIFDIHRDAILNPYGRYVRTMADIPGVEASQVMLVIGTDHAGLYHPHWRENFRFALHLQHAMVERYPTLARPIDLREERFNAHLAPGAILVEIGTCANTLQEALAASRLFAEVAADVMLGLG